MHLMAVRIAGRDQVAHDFVLAVDGDRAAAGQPAQVDPVTLAGEQQLDAVMFEPLAPHPVAEAGFVQRVDRSLLEHAGANAVLAVFPRAGFDEDGIDALQAQQMGKQKAGRTGADDGDLGAHCSSPEH